MQGAVTTTRFGPLAVHTYTSPEAGLAANTHLIELPTQILVVDAQYGLPFAAEVAEFARTLVKPVTRVYVSHAHPDHFFGAAVFDAPVHALASVRDTIAETGDVMAANNHAQFGDFVPDHATVPDVVVTPGEEVVDGVRLEFREVTESEADSMLVIALPDQNTVLALDLVYSGLHLFIAEGHLDGWQRAIEQLRAEGHAIVLPGHGAPGGPELYDFVLDYLQVARRALAEASTGAELKDVLVRAFPEAGGVLLLDIQNGYLFPQQSTQ